MVQPTVIVGYGATDPGYQEPSRLNRKSLHRDLSCVVVIPTRGAIPAQVVDAWLSLAHPPNQRHTQMVISGMEVGAAYTSAVEIIRAQPELSRWRYMLTLEEDNLPTPYALVDLLDAADEGDWDVLGGLYYTKGEDGVAQIWGDPSDPAENYRPQLPDLDGGIVRCNATGMGFTVFRLDQFKRMEPPWFVTPANPVDGLWSQDLFYFHRARQEGVDLKIGVHCGVRVGHLDTSTEVVW